MIKSLLKKQGTYIAFCGRNHLVTTEYAESLPEKTGHKEPGRQYEAAADGRYREVHARHPFGKGVSTRTLFDCGTMDK